MVQYLKAKKKNEKNLRLGYGWDIPQATYNVEQTSDQHRYTTCTRRIFAAQP